MILQLLKWLTATVIVFTYENDNPYGIFHFPYNLHHEESCPNNMPNMYDLINDLNTFLSPQYGHTGHAFICTFEGPPAPACKIMFEIVGSDLSFQNGSQSIGGLMWTTVNVFSQFAILPIIQWQRVIIAFHLIIVKVSCL